MTPYTKIIDDEFAKVIVSNQLHFHTEGYIFKNFSFKDPENDPEDNLFSTNFQKYLNIVVGRRLERYKHAMRDIPPLAGIHNRDVTGTKFYNMVESVCRIFNRHDYSHENLMIACADLCSFTRCAFMKGLRSSYWPKYLLAEGLLLMRDCRNSFSDQTYEDLNEWLKEKVSFYEDLAEPLSLTPIEFSLEWVNYPRHSGEGSSNRDSSSRSPDYYGFKDKPAKHLRL